MACGQNLDTSKGRRGQKMLRTAVIVLVRRPRYYAYHASIRVSELVQPETHRVDHHLCRR